MEPFTNQVVWITGASSGIGEALALECASRGADLVLLARRTDRLEALEKRIRERGRKALSISCDVTRPEDLRKAVEETLSRFGRINVVVANAGFAVGGYFEKLSVEDFRRQFETNFFGALETAYATLGELKKTRGRLVFVGSVNGHVALPTASAYVASKFAVRGLAESLYYELRPFGVSVTHISPGFVATEIRTVSNQGKKSADLKDEVPEWLRMPAPKAAKQIADTIAKRVPERVITLHGKLGVFLVHHFPGLVRFALKQMAGQFTWRKEES